MKTVRDIDLFLLDMDGTIYLGDRLFDCTKPFLETVRAQGRRHLFLTNNSSKDRTAYVAKLGRLGIDAAHGHGDNLRAAGFRHLGNEVVGTVLARADVVREVVTHLPASAVLVEIYVDEVVVGQCASIAVADVAKEKRLVGKTARCDAYGENRERKTLQI